MSRCRSCGAEIVWVKTMSRKLMPVDAGTWEEGDEFYKPQKHVSHFATCPQAGKWRRNRESSDDKGANE